jgi:hypothetical protein
MQNVTQAAETLQAANESMKTDAQREAEAKAAALQAEREAKAAAKNPGVIAKNAVLSALKKSLAEDIDDSISHGADPRMEMALTAKHSKAGAAMMANMGETARASFYSLQAETADRNDQSASSLSFLKGIPVLQGLARTHVDRYDALRHQQTKLIGRLNRSGDDLAKALNAVHRMVRVEE